MTTLDDIFMDINADRNIILHGPGGTGKTYTIREIHAEYKHYKKRIEIAAPTGKAAVELNLDANTIHSLFGISPLDTTDISEVEILREIAKICKNPRIQSTLSSMDMLIIDEISMVGYVSFRIMDGVLRNIKKNDKAFGGVQCIFSGDFKQLPPVKDKFCFHSDVWKELDLKVINFIEPKRYTDLNTFDFLLRLRDAKLTEDDMEFLNERRQAFIRKEYLDKEKFKIMPVVLFSSNAEAAKVNKKRLKELLGSTFISLAVDKVEYKDESIDKFQTGADKKFQENMIARERNVRKCLEDIMPAKLELKEGAKIIFCRNYNKDLNLVNGMMGVIVEIDDGWIDVKIENGTVHRIQKASYLINTRYFSCSRIQYPFKLAWALTIHKSQGATLNAAIISLKNIFAPGQAYVALSRVVNMNNIFIAKKIDFSAITANRDIPSEFN